MREGGRGAGFGSRDCNPSKERVDHTLSQGLNISRENPNVKIANVKMSQSWWSTLSKSLIFLDEISNVKI